MEALPPEKPKCTAVLHGLDYYLRGGIRHDFDPENCEICREAYGRDPDSFGVFVVSGVVNIKKLGTEDRDG